MKINTLIAALLLTSAPVHAVAQESAPAETLDEVAAKLVDQVREAEAELRKVREETNETLLPLRARLAELREQVIEAEEANKAIRREKDRDASALLTLSKNIEKRESSTANLTALLNDYIRNFGSRVHIAESQLYEDQVTAAVEALGADDMTQSEVFAVQLAVIDASLDRMLELGGGLVFEGEAEAADGSIREGKFLVVGPAGLFRSKDGKIVGTAEQRVGSILAVVEPFANEEDTLAASAVVAAGSGLMPLDVTGGKAHKIAATQDTLIEHISKGGAIMIPILAMAGLALLVALFKWIQFLFVRRPRKKKLKKLIEAVREGDEESAARRAREIKGPAGRMLESGVATMRRSRDLMEDSMYETVLDTKTRLQKALPFIAICAASAPLLGLLGTVTGIINTFKQITVFGSGDVKQLSGGISEALITTKFGLIVAIPSLLLHAYLSRRARGVITDMESSAVKFANEVARSETFGEAAEAKRQNMSFPGAPTPEHEIVRGQVAEILSDMLGPLSNDPSPGFGHPKAGNAPGGGV